MTVETITTFEEADYNWVKRETARRGITIKELVNELMQRYLPNGFETKRAMSEEEFGEHLSGIVRGLVRRARMEIQ